MKNTYTSEQKQTIIARYISGGETYSQINADTGIAEQKLTRCYMKILKCNYN